MKSICGSIINEVEDFKYLGSYIRSTKRDVNIRIAKAWAALNSMNTIWKSKLSTNLKRHFFRVAVESENRNNKISSISNQFGNFFLIIFFLSKINIIYIFTEPFKFYNISCILVFTNLQKKKNDRTN